MRPMRDAWKRARNKWCRFSTEHLGRRDFTLRTDVPYVSFTFDDFPRSALIEGGSILERHGVRGTFFVSLQLLGADSPSGRIATKSDLEALVSAGHELGCHTFEHLDGRTSSVETFERSVAANTAALAQVLPGGRFNVFAYPLDGPTVRIKRAVGRHFVCCRGSGQAFNTGRIDLNLLKSYFLDWRCRGSLSETRKTIAQNAEARGWLVFATHDVTRQPSHYGCEPEFFESVLGLAIDSGARVVPVARACEELLITAQVRQ